MPLTGIDLQPFSPKADSLTAKQNRAGHWGLCLSPTRLVPFHF